MSVTVSTLDLGAVQTLAGSLRGQLVEPQHAGYDEARRLYNASTGGRR
jgi:hypothetical protein